MYESHSRGAGPGTSTVDRVPTSLEALDYRSDDDSSPRLRLAIRRAAEPHVLYNSTKRAIDIVASAGLLLALSPVFLAVMAVNWLTGREVFFGQRRIGLGGREFVCWKFRSMVPGAEAMREQLDYLNITEGPTFKNPNDPRLTRFGRLIRKTSIDELPQLWNVLKGDMSLVGPRPLAVKENRYRDGQQLRLGVKPGLTCIWQVSGRSNIAFERWMELDLDYVEKRSLLFDLSLLLKTIPAVLSGKGAI